MVSSFENISSVLKQGKSETTYFLLEGGQILLGSFLYYHYDERKNGYLFHEAFA